MLSLALRVLFLGLLALGLSNPVRSEFTARICTVLLVDVSDSVSDEALPVDRPAHDSGVCWAAKTVEARPGRAGVLGSERSRRASGRANADPVFGTTGSNEMSAVTVTALPPR